METFDGEHAMRAGRFILVLTAFLIPLVHAPAAGARRTCEDELPRITARFATSLGRAARQCVRRTGSCPDRRMARTILRLRDRAADRLVRRCPLHDVSGILNAVQEEVLCAVLAHCGSGASTLEVRFPPPSHQAPATGDVDVGFTGNAHDLVMLGGAGFRAELRDCDGTACNLYGAVAGASLGAPSPLSAGGVPLCVTLRFVADSIGSFDSATGDLAVRMPLRIELFIGTDVAQPCPACVPFESADGAQLGESGLCASGPNDGAFCLVEGLNDPAFGIAAATSSACPPAAGARIVGFDIDVAATTGSTSFPAARPCASPFSQHLACWCPGQPQPNACEDEVCAATASGGVCPGGPADGRCAREPFRGCLDDAHCPAGGDECLVAARACFPDPIERRGAADPPRDGVAHPVVAGALCFPATSVGAVNTAAGFPGPGAFVLPAELALVPDGAAER
jgi:hypothetical protein